MWKQGFSLVEIMVAVVLVSVLSSVAYSYYLGNIHQARIAKLNADFKTISDSARRYYLENGNWPRSVSEMVPRFLERTGADPWGNMYVIRTSSEVSVYSGASIESFFVGSSSGQTKSQQFSSYLSTGEILWHKVDSE
ncbi:MAG: prepilin-type N-terminal cleavage/methylation domain-containing protein [Candidatus Wallbacteria bacterium]|nr:prepilin-type N-terminal cleavage/methylation domain-containing protein [Candidatus Wallbacteria bacterium]